jgi:hypothetical protein
MKMLGGVVSKKNFEIMWTIRFRVFLGVVTSNTVQVILAVTFFKLYRSFSFSEDVTNASLKIGAS